MKNYIVITRAIEADRPSEEQILADSIALNEGQQPSQDPTKDNFFVATGDITKIMTKWLAQNDVNPYGIKPGDGLAIYPADSRARGGELREGSKAVLVVGGVATEYDTLAEARTAIGALDPNQGYELQDLEQPVGSADTEVIEARPNLAPQTDGAGGVSNIDVDLSIKVKHANRVDDSNRY